MNFKNPRNILVIGAGGSGVSAARLARSEGHQVTLLDEKRPAGHLLLQAECREKGIAYLPEFSGGEFPETYDTIILSPGIAKNSRMGKMAEASGARLLSELAFAAERCPWPAIGITGTNGKTTTVELLTHCLNTAGIKAAAGGNIGLPLSQLILDRPKLEFVVLEISTFQMEFTPADFKTAAAALLNITPDHLNRHGSYQTYQNLKLAVLKSCPPDRTVCNEHLPVRLDGSLHPATFSGQEGSSADFQVRGGFLGYLQDGDFRQLIPTDELPFTGRHNIENTLAVLALAQKAGISPQRMIPGIRSFRTGPHRIQRIAAHDGVTYIDDSKATNADAVIQALASLPEFKGKIHLIAGGADKGCDLKELIPNLQNCVKQVYLIGACRERLKTAWQGLIPLRTCDTLQDAVRAASTAAAAGDAVLLSPACASQDMFKDYIQRGQVFADEVKSIISPKQTI